MGGPPVLTAALNVAVWPPAPRAAAAAMAVRFVMAAALLSRMGPTWMAALYLYDFTLVHGFSTTAANLLLLIYIAAGFVGSPAVCALAARMNKHRALMGCTSLFALCIVGTLLIPRGD